MSEILVDLPMAFGDKQTEELADVILKPKGEVINGVITYPNGMKIHDFFEIVFVGTREGIAGIRGGYTTPKEELYVGNVLRLSMSSDTTGAESIITFTSETELTYSGSGTAKGGLSTVVGRIKKYATTNLSVTIPVNNGNNITTDARYEIPASSLPANFLDKNGNIKKNVTLLAEIFNNSGAGVADFGDSGFVAIREGGTGSVVKGNGVKATKAGDMIVVQTGSAALATTSNLSGNGFGIVDVITSTTCQVVATLSGEAYTVQTS